MKLDQHLRSFLVALAALCLMHGAKAEAVAASPTPRPLQFGVLNQQSAIQTAERWNPILRYITRKTGIPLQLKMGATVEQTNAMMGREEFDLVFTNHSFQAKFDGQYKVLARWAGKPIHGVLIVPETSPVRTLTDLQSLTVAFPSPDAFVAHAVPLAVFREAGVTVRHRFAGHQEGAMAQLKAKRVDAAAVNSRFLAIYAERENLRYRTIHESEPYHELPVMIHPRVPVELVSALQRALLGMSADPEAREILHTTHSEGFEAAEERDYDNIRRIYRAIGK